MKKIIFGLLILILVSVGFWIRWYVNDALSQENLMRTLQERATAKDSTLQISTDSLIVDTKNYSVAFWGLRLENSSENGESLEFKIHLKEVQMREFAIWDYIFSDEIHFSKFEIRGGTASFIPSTISSQTDSLTRRELFNKTLSNITSQFELLSVDSIFVDLDEISIGEESAQKLENLHFATHNFLMQDSEYSPITITYAAVSVETFTSKESKSQYNQTLKNFRLDFETSNISVESYHIKPKVSSVRYEKFLPFQEPWVDAEISAISISNIDFMRLMLERELLISHISLEDIRLKVYKDRRLPLSKSVYRKMPHEMLQSLEFPAKIDTFHLKKMDVVYTENAPNGFVGLAGPGRIFFDKVELFATDISTFTSGENQKTARIRTGGLLNNRAPISIQMDYPFSTSHFSMKFDGKLSFCDAHLLNDLTVPSLRIRFDEGFIEELTFSGDVKKGISKGEMGVKYKDLKISILRPHQDDKREILSIIGNWAIAAASSSQGTPVKRNSDFTYKRQNEIGFPGFLWRSIQDGLTKVIIQESAQKQFFKRSKSRK